LVGDESHLCNAPLSLHEGLRDWCPISQFAELRRAKTTLYALADHQCEEELPAIITELNQARTKTHWLRDDAERVIKTVSHRHDFGDHRSNTCAASGAGRDEHGMAKQSLHLRSASQRR